MTSPTSTSGAGIVSPKNMTRGSDMHLRDPKYAGAIAASPLDDLMSQTGDKFTVHL